MSSFIISNGLLRSQFNKLTGQEIKLLGYCLSVLDIETYEKLLDERSNFRDAWKFSGVRDLTVLEPCLYQQIDLKKYASIAKKNKPWAKGDIVSLFKGLEKKYFLIRGKAQGRWITDLNLSETQNGLISFRWGRFLEPHLFNLEREFSILDQDDLLNLKKKHAVSFYCFLCSWSGKGEIFKIPFEELKEAFNSTASTDFKVFNHNILRPAVKEIEEALGWKIEITYIKEHSRAVTHLNIKFWRPKKKKAVDEEPRLL